MSFICLSHPCFGSNPLLSKLLDKRTKKTLNRGLSLSKQRVGYWNASGRGGNTARGRTPYRRRNPTSVVPGTLSEAKALSRLELYTSLKGFITTLATRRK